MSIESRRCNARTPCYTSTRRRRLTSSCQQRPQRQPLHEEHRAHKRECYGRRQEDPLWYGQQQQLNVPQVERCKGAAEGPLPPPLLGHAALGVDAFIDD
eukprot:scaffold3577_cov63-Phaeocystis_antarctica.AAC.6